MKGRAALLRALVCLSTTAACGEDLTEIVVVVTSDAPVETVQITVASSGSTVFDATEPVAETPLPMTLSLTPGGAKDAEVLVTVTGRTDAGVSIRRAARTRFVEGRRLLLHIALERACDGIGCGGGMTCAGGDCTTDEIADLPEWRDVVPAQPDAGAPVDGGGDAGGSCDDGIEVGGTCYRVPWHEHALGTEHMCTIFEVSTGVGQVYCRGANGAGQLGVGDTMTRAEHVAVAGLDDGARLALGRTHSCAIAQGAAVLCWGSNAMGQLGVDPATEPTATTPVPVVDEMDAPLTMATRIALGDTHTCAIVRGVMYCWGANGEGQLGDGTTTQSHVPRRIGAPVGFSRVAAGTSFSCAVRMSGDVYCWGGNNRGQLGVTGMPRSSMPIVVPLPAGVSASDVVTGQTHACALTSNGVYCWGDGSMGQLGYGGTDTDVPPTLVTLPEVPVEITAGLQHTCALTERSGVYCWGSNASGQLIADLGSVVDAPARIVPATEGPIGVWAGGFTTCAWTNTGPLCAGRQTL